jgi:hypothetical protein
MLRAVAADVTRVEFAESEELFANPGMGWQTFHQFADRDKALQGLPSASAYFRFYWREIEPRDGAIDFAQFDDLLGRARAAGQKFAFRVMTTGSGGYSDAPAWLKDQGCTGIEFTYGGRTHWVPDFSDPLFQEKHFRLIRELGRRYDGHPDLDLVDIGSVGLWGEWHMSSTKAIATGKPVPMPSPEMQHKIIDAWCAAFPKTPKVALIGSEVGMRGAVKAGYGWRADCLGDMGGFSKTWNHMDNFYLQQLTKTGAEDAWQHGPVAFESCWDMRKWSEESWDVRHIFDYALRLHTSYVNNKSAPIPAEARAEVERFLKRIGYRLVLREVEHPSSVRAGEPLVLTTTWENVGVAPPYRDYVLATRLVQQNGDTNSAILSVSGSSVRGWLPGKKTPVLRANIPATAVAGPYHLDVGIVDPLTHSPAVRIAITNQLADGWHRVSRINVIK